MREKLFQVIDRLRRSAAGPLVRASGVVGAAQYFAAALAALTNLVMARVLGPEEFGTVVLIFAYPALLASLAAVKSASVTPRYIIRFKDSRQLAELGAICKVAWTIDAAAAGIAGIVCLVTAGPFAGDLLGLHGEAWLMLVYAASLPFQSLTGTSYAVLASCERFTLLALGQVWERAVTLCLVVAALVFDSGASGVVVAAALGNVVAGPTTILLAHEALRREGFKGWWRQRMAAVRSHRRELAAFFGWNYLAVTLNGILFQGPLLLLGHAQGPRDAAFYRLGLTVASLATQLEAALSRVTSPRLAALWLRQDRDVIRTTVRRWILYGGVPLGIICSGCVALVPVLVPVVFGSAYESAAGSAQFLLGGAAVSLVFFPVVPLLYAVGKPALYGKAYAAYAVVAVVAAWAVAQPWGSLGVAGVVACGSAVFNVALACAAARLLAHPSVAATRMARG